MADSELPTNYDAIVLGTGLTESIVAAALARIGWKVLHLDRNDCYSGDWAAYHFEGLRAWVKSHTEESQEPELTSKVTDIQSHLEAGEQSISLQIHSTTISNVKQYIHVREKLPDPPKPATLETKEDKDVSVLSQVEDSEKQTDVEKKGGDDDTGATTGDKESGVDNKASEEHQSTTEPSAKSDTEPKTINEETKYAESSKPKDDQEKKTEDTIKAVKKQWSFEGINQLWRKFNIDLSPRVLFCRGAMVELLISSDIAKYCEFRTVTRVLTETDGKLEQVPCSRSDVFSSKQVSMIEKRMLMKLLTFCLNYQDQPQEYAGFEDKTFKEFLKSKKLTPRILHYVCDAIAMATDQTLTLEGLKSTQHFLQSLGRYGNTAFLWPLYGSGDIPQCFCRMCAVFGGIYCLRRAGHAVVVKDNVVQGIVDTENTRLTAKHVILEASYATPECNLALAKQDRLISRAILLTDRSLTPAADNADHISLLTLPPGGAQQNTVQVLELSHLSLSCPKDIYVVHLTCRGGQTAEQDLKSIIEKFFQFASPEDDGSGVESAEDSRPMVLWSMYFNMADSSAMETHTGIEGLHVTGGPDLSLDMDHAITQARQIFDKLCPGEEFLPKAPNPEDIIFDDGAQPAQGSGFEPDAEKGGEEQPSKDGESEGGVAGGQQDGEKKEGAEGGKTDGQCDEQKGDSSAGAGVKSNESENSEDTDCEKKMENLNLENKDKQSSDTNLS